jgi:HK97 gp10 family phage protein
MANKSVERFRKLTLDMQRQVYNDAITELPAQAATLVTMMKAVVAHGPTGHLANSIRQQPGPRPTIVKVMAGGASTTTPGAAGRPPYDYARAVEFGTVKISAQPFFFPTFRLMRKRMRSSMRNKITRTIKKYSAA